MPASKAEQVLEALKTLLETVPDASVERNSVLPEKVPAGGLVIMRDGDPGEPERALGGFGSAYYQHAVEIEVYWSRARMGRLGSAQDPTQRDSCRASPLTQKRVHTGRYGGCGGAIWTLCTSWREGWRAGCGAG